ncbi:MAG: RNA polymerase sigma factor [Janthinobacterium lividum]
MKTLEQDHELQLVQRLYARDEKAMTFFYRNYKQALYHAIWRIVRQDELTEDILQESMLKFWLSFADYQAGRGRLFTWALTISRNIAIDRLREVRHRAAQRTSSLSEQDFPYLIAAPTFQPEHIGVHDWLNVLSTSDRELMEALYFKGHTQVETAEALRLSLGTVKSRSARIVRTLARVMREENS